MICEIPDDQDDFVEEGIDLSNITFIDVGINAVEQVWIRDYGPHTLYAHEVDEMMLVDWLYESTSPVIDTIASFALALHYDLPLYLTTQSPLDFRLDGGNLLADGLGTAFSSKRVLSENGNEEFVDMIMEQFMGVQQYIKFDKLDHDVIHHVDMHMKLLDEETILFGEYPEGISDWDQIEENIQTLMEQYLSPFGTEYEIKRILMPPDINGNYPGEENNGIDLFRHWRGLL